MAGVLVTKGRGIQISAIMFGTLMILSRIAGAAFADVSAAAAQKVTICHANNAASNPYVEEEVPYSSVDGEGSNDHTLHTGPIALSVEHATQLKDAGTNWGDIIPPFGDFEGLNWTEDGIAIFENHCAYETASEDGSTDDGTADDGSADDGSADDGSADDGSTDDGSTDDGSSDDGSADDGSTDDGSSDDGSADDGSTDDGSSDDGTVDDGTVDGDTQVEGNVITKAKPKTDVEGATLATTGPETTMLTIIGSLFLMLGLAMRFGRFGRPVYAVDGQVADALKRRTRNSTCRD